MNLSSSLKSFFNRVMANSGPIVTDSMASAPGVNSVELNSLRVVDLKAMAKDRGLTGYSKLNKAQLLELLK